MWYYVEGSLCMTSGLLNGSYLTRVLKILSITWCCQGQQCMYSLLYQLRFNNFKVTICVTFISWFSWPYCFTRVPSCRSFQWIMLRPFSVVRNAVETTVLLALRDYFTNGILMIGRITFFNQTYSRWNWRFLATVLSKLYLQMELKNNEIK